MNTTEAVYHVGINGAPAGPFPESEIRSRIARRLLGGADLCWRDGWPDWQPLARVFPDAFSASRSAFPPSPPPAPGPFSHAARHPSYGPASPVAIQGKELVVPLDLPFPPICIRTGATEDLREKPVRCRLAWHTPMVYLALIANVLIYLVVAAIVSKKSNHLVYLSRAARATQIKWHLANWCVFIGIWVMIALAGVYESSLFGLASLACLVACIVIYFTKVRLIYASKIDQTHAYIRGIRPDVQTRLVEIWR